MARRSVVPARQMTPEQARGAIIRHFAHLNAAGGVNMAQFEAQRAEQSMVRVLVDMATDVSGEIPHALRARCAMDVVAIARGPLKPWLHQGETVDPNARAPDEKRTVGENMESAQVLADVSEELDRLVSRRVPPEQWPEHVRAAVGDTLSYYSETADD